jgi:rhodanese-related sulfurtransferase
MDSLLPFMTENWELCALLGLLFVVYISIEYKVQSSRAGTLSPQLAALQMNRKNTWVVDIRKPEDYQASHIIGSIHCAVSDLKKLSQAEGIPPAHKKNLKAHTIIIVDANGQKAGKAATTLKKEGYTSVMILRGGIHAWVQEKMPLPKASKGRPVEEIEDQKDLPKKPVKSKKKPVKKEKS